MCLHIYIHIYIHMYICLRPDGGVEGWCAQVKSRQSFAAVLHGTRREAGKKKRMKKKDERENGKEQN